MLKVKTLVVLSMLFQLSANFAFASDEVTVLESETSYVVKDSSEFNRMNKKYSLSYESSSGIIFQGAAIVGSYLLNRNDLILLELRSEKVFLGTILAAAFGYKEDTRNDSFGVNYKHFFGNSFFIRSGLSYHNVSDSSKYVGSVSTTSDSFSFTGNLTNFGIGIGNDWQWDKFTLGFDWIRITIPVAHTITDEQYTSNNKSSIEFNEDIFFRKTAISSAMHLGVSF